MIYRTFVMAGRIMQLVVDVDHDQVRVTTGPHATQDELDLDDYDAHYISKERFV
jgi:hypothetical protein